MSHVSVFDCAPAMGESARRGSSLLAKHRLLIIEIYAFNIVAAASILNNEISSSDSAGDAAAEPGMGASPRCRCKRDGEGGHDTGTNWPHVCLLSRGE